MRILGPAAVGPNVDRIPGLQASSVKLDSWSGMCYYRIIKEKYMDNENLKRIADALEEILQLVKQDMERMKKLND